MTSINHPQDFLISSQQRNITIVYFLAFIGLGMASSILGPTLQSLAEQTSSSLNEISIVFILKSLGFLLGSFFVGRLYDRVPGHPILTFATVGAAAALFVVPLSGELMLLGVIVFLWGVCMGSLDVGGNTLLVWVHRDKVGPYMNGLHLMWGLGAALTPLILERLGSLANGDNAVALDVRWTYWIIGLFLLPLALGLMKLPSPSPVEASPSEDAADGASSKLLLGLLVLFYFLLIGAEVSITGWIVTYTTETGLADKTTANYLNSTFFVALTITRLVMIPLAMRFRASRILMVDLLICIASAVLMVMLPLSWPAILAGIIGLGIGMASIFPMMLAFAQNRMPVTGKITSWIFLGASAGGMTIPWGIGQLFERINPQVVLMSILLCVLGTSLVFWVINTGWERRAVVSAE